MIFQATDRIIQIVEQLPSVEQYLSLRVSVGWGNIPVEACQFALNHTLHAFCAVDAFNNMVACGRMVGDGAIYCYIQDVIVHPSYQKKGIGKAIVENLVNSLDRTIFEGIFIALIAAHGTCEFYKKLGFVLSSEKGEFMYFLK